MRQSSNIKETIINFALGVTEVIVSIIESISIVGGIIGANIADIAFGTIALNFMFSGSNMLIAGMTPVLYISLAVSAGTSAIQIYLWTLLRRRGIGYNEIINFKKLPANIKSFLLGAGIIWLADTLLDISPLALLMRGSLFEGSGMYALVKIIVYLLVFLLCGFAEPLTANMVDMLEGGKIGKSDINHQKPNNPYGNFNPNHQNKSNNAQNPSWSNNDSKATSNNNQQGKSQSNHTSNTNKQNGDVSAYLAGLQKNTNATKQSNNRANSQTYADIMKEILEEDEKDSV
jgi:hypothetical protein